MKLEDPVSLTVIRRVIKSITMNRQPKAHQLLKAVRQNREYTRSHVAEQILRSEDWLMKAEQGHVSLEVFKVVITRWTTALDLHSGDEACLIHMRTREVLEEYIHKIAGDEDFSYQVANLIACWKVLPRKDKFIAQTDVARAALPHLPLMSKDLIEARFRVNEEQKT